MKVRSFFLAILSSAVIALITLFLAELALRLFFPTITNIFLEPVANLIKDPDHRMKPHQAEDINADGIRSYRTANDFPEQDFNVIFIGDSYTYGYMLKSEESIPSQFEKLAREGNKSAKNINVANFGWISSSPILDIRLLQDIGEKYHPDLIILILDMTDFHDDITYRHMFDHDRIFWFGQYFPGATAAALYLAKFVFKFDFVSVALTGAPLQKYFITEEKSERADFALNNTMNLIRDINTYSNEKLNAKFMLYVLPRYFQYNIKESPNDWSIWSTHDPAKMPPDFAEQPFTFFESIKGSERFPVISLLDDFKKTSLFPTTFKGDPHLNRQGSQFAAEAIYRHCLERNCLDSQENKK